MERGWIFKLVPMIRTKLDVDDVVIRERVEKVEKISTGHMWWSHFVTPG